MSSGNNTIVEALSSEIIQILETQKDFKNDDIQKVLKSFEQADYPQSESQKQEYNAQLDALAADLKNANPQGNFENMNEDFEELNSMYNGNPYASSAGNIYLFLLQK